MKNNAVFLDRDGVINEIVYHKEMGIVDSPFTVEQFMLIKDIDKAINKFKELGFKVIIISNQPGVAKNHHDMITFEKIKEKMHIDFLKKGIKIDAEYYCFHHPDAVINKYRELADPQGDNEKSRDQFDNHAYKKMTEKNMPIGLPAQFCCQKR